MADDLHNDRDPSSPSSTPNTNGTTRTTSKRTLLLAFIAAAFAAWIFISLNIFG